MKAILMSIKPKRCEKIFSGEKTIEVRKTAPKETPFKVYVYQTKYRLGNKFIDEVLNTVYDGGKVVGEFVCDRVEHYYANERGWYGYPHEETCLRCAEIAHYGKQKRLFGWHITTPKLYDTPKELEVFWTVRCTNKTGDCKKCEVKPACISNVTRPPQSWMYCCERND